MGSKTDELLQKVIEATDPFRYARFAGEHESVIQAAATAGLVVRPTTVGAITIWNGESSGGRSLIIDRIFTHNLVSTAVKTYYGLWYCVHKDMVRPTNDITTLRGTGDGVGPNVNVVVVDVAATVLDDGWFPCGREGSISETGTTPQSIAEWEAMGRLVVPPKAGLSIQVVSSVTGDTFTSGVSWWRHQL